MTGSWRSAQAAGLLLLMLMPGLARGEVVINELLAANDLVLADFQGDYPDWVELHNPGPASVNLSGFHLTDDPNDPFKWTFPAPTPLAAGGYLVVFASDKDRAYAGQELHTNFKLTADGEYLALTAPAGEIVSALTFPRQVTDVSYGRAAGTGSTTPMGYFAAPSPRAANGVAGAAVLQVTHSPRAPGVGDDIIVKAEIAPPEHQTVTGAQLHFRIQFSPELTVAMADSGVWPDEAPGDGIWTTRLPAGMTPTGQMVRWRVTATDSGGGPPARLPLFLSPTNSPQYLGAMVADPGVSSALPVFYWFVESPSAANTLGGTRCVVWFLDELYDNVFVRIRGNTSRWWPKKNYKFDFNKGNHFRFDAAQGRVEEMNVNSSWSDKAYVRRVLAWETYRDAGVAGSLGIPWRVQQNGQFFSVATFIEQPDEELLERNGLDPDGALYKMYNQLTSSSSGVEKKTRQWEGNGDLQVLVTSIQQSGMALEIYLMDSVDLPAVGNYLAATSIMHDNDHVAKNYYLYRDSDGDGEWRFVPWDKDLTFGRNYTLGGGVLNDTMWASTPIQSHPLFGDSQHRKIDNLWNRLIDACYRTPRVREIMLRRLRTLMDEQLDPPGTPPASLHFEGRIQQLVTQMGPDVSLDQARWGVPTWGSPFYNFPNAIAQLENDYLAPRRTYLYFTHGPGGTGLIPPAQASVAVMFGSVERSPPSGDQDEEYVEIINLAPTAVDLSGWQLDDGISFTFDPGTVIPASDHLYVSPDLPTFRARAAPPTGGQGNLVVGPYRGHVAPHEGLRLLDAQGNVVDLIAGTLCGDCNNDGSVSVLDTLAAAQHAVNVQILTDPDFARCNVEGVLGGQSVPGAVVDTLDALAIARSAAGLAGSLSCVP